MSQKKLTSISISEVMPSFPPLLRQPSPRQPPPPRAPSPLRHPHPRAFPPPETSPQFDDHHSVKYRSTLRSSTCRHPFLTLIIRWKRTGAYPVNLCSLPWAIESTQTGYDERGYSSCVLVPLTGKSEKALASFSISEAMSLEPQRRAPLTRT